MADIGFDTRKRKRRAWSAQLRGPALGGPNLMVQAVCGILAAAAAIACLSLWIVPSDAYGADLYAMKVAVSIALGVLSVVVWRKGFAARPPDVHIDFDRKEVRVIQDIGGRDLVRAVHPFSSLAALFIENHTLFVFLEEQVPLAVLPLDPRVEAEISA